MSKCQKNRVEIGFPVYDLKSALCNCQIKGELYEHPEREEQGLSGNCASPTWRHLQYGPALPMQRSICRAGWKPTPAAQARGWEKRIPALPKTLMQPPEPAASVHESTGVGGSKGARGLLCQEVPSRKLWGWGVHLQPGWRKSTLAPFMAG